MRRHLLRFLPVFLLALMVQILAPVGACLARSIAATDPLANAVLCQGVVGNHDSDQQPNHHMRDGSCSICAAAHAAAPPVPAVVEAGIIRHADVVVWRAYAPRARVAKLASHAQARGPPFLS